jgi:ABC-type Fe3+-hydroxamate transport system substrate-binding protein
MRIVSLCPSLTELVIDLGLEDQLVGRTKFCVHPEGRVERIEKVGGTKNPKIERIIELDPDLVLLNEEENRIEDAEALAVADLRCHSSMPVSVADTAEMVRSIGRAVDRPVEAESIAADIERRAARVRAAAEDRPAATYAYLIWREPIMTVNDDTFVAALLGLAGGVNVFGDAVERYPTITAEQLTAADPNGVLLSTEPFPFDEKYRDELVEATGLPAERFRIVDGELLSWHGSRTPAGIDYAERVVEGLREAV